MPVIKRHISLKKRERESFLSMSKNKDGFVLWLCGRYNDAATIARHANMPRTFLFLINSDDIRIMIEKTNNMISGVMNLRFSMMFKIPNPLIFV